MTITCKSRAYKSQQQAAVVAANLAEKVGVHVQAYACPTCYKWHVRKVHSVGGTNAPRF